MYAWAGSGCTRGGGVTGKAEGAGDVAAVGGVVDIWAES